MLLNVKAFATNSPKNAGDKPVTTVTTPVFDNVPADLTLTPNAAGPSPFTACPTSDIIVPNAPGQCQASVDFVANPNPNFNYSYNPAYTLNPIVGITSPGPFPVGTTMITRSITVLNGSANPLGLATNVTYSCVFKIVVQDVEVPQAAICTVTASGVPLAFHGTTTLNVDPGTCTKAIHINLTNITENCGVQGFYIDFNNGSPLVPFGNNTDVNFPKGTTTFTLLIKDVNGNFSGRNCFYTVIINDNIPPVIDCAAAEASVVVSAANSGCGATATFTVSATDNCTPAPTLNLVAGSTSGSVFQVGTTAVTYTATDGSGNVSLQCTFNVVVKDVTAPVFTNCPINTTVNTDAGLCTAVFNYPTLVAVDNCGPGGAPGPVTTTRTAGLASGSAFPKGVTTVTYTSTDGAAIPNTSTCTFTVTVIDNQPAVFSNCPANVLVYSTPEVCGYVFTYTAPTAVDNCPTPGTVLTVTPDAGNLASGSVFPFGTSTLSFTASDGIVTSTCSYIVRVINTERENVTITSVGNFCSGGVGYLTATGMTNRITTYKWQRKAAGGSSFVDVTAPADYSAGGGILYTTPLLTSANNGDQYQVVLTTKCGIAVSSPPFTLRVLECYVPIGFHRFPDGLPACAQQAFRNLEKVYNTINGANWNSNAGWFTDANMNNWYGVTMTDDGCDVKSIKLAKNLKRKGTDGVDYIVGMPQSFKGSLNQISFPKLEELDLSGNNISFQIYDYNFPKLKILNLSNNNLSSNLPLLGDLPSLETFLVNNNQLEGDVPDFIFKLKKFDLRNNKFTFSNLSNLIDAPTTILAYAPQAPIQLKLIDGELIANTGSNNNANGMEQYTWHNNGDVLATTTSNGFVPTTEGTYSVAVTHKDLTVTTDVDKNLVLSSNEVKVDAPMIESLRTLNNSKSNNAKSALSLFPNPASNEVRIEFNSTAKGDVNATMRVYDIIGKVVGTQTLNSNITTLNVSNFVNGSYIVEVESNGEKFRSKLVKN